MHHLKEQFSRMEQLITEIVYQEGINPSHKGFRYIHQAVRIILMEKDRLDALTKEVYGPIAEENHTSIACVERAIRFAIRSGVDADKRGESLMDTPSNKVFIARLVHKTQRQEQFQQLLQ
jgi:two-component system response regulator (stage 0 sporulation protein A)